MQRGEGAIRDVRALPERVRGRFPKVLRNLGPPQQQAESEARFAAERKNLLPARRNPATETGSFACSDCPRGGPLLDLVEYARTCSVLLLKEVTGPCALHLHISMSIID